MSTKASTTHPPVLARAARDAGRWLSELESGSVTLAVIVVLVVIGVSHPAFLSPGSLLDVVEQAAFVGIIAAGVAFLLAMREIDLSVGSIFGVAVVSGALLIRAGWDPWLAAVGCIVVGALAGLFNALLVQGIAIPAIIATLGTMSMYRGLAQALTDGEQIVGMPHEHGFFVHIGGELFGIPVGIWTLVAVVALLTVVLRLTPFGYRVRAIGSNPEAAAHSGISVGRTRVQALVLVGALCGVAAVLGLAYFSSGDPNIGAGFELQAIAATVIGGTPLAGGRATVVGAAIGAILLGVVNSGLVYFDVPLNWSSFATGAVIIAAVSIDAFLRRRRGRAERL
ncbi:MAG: ABC transporter permease [Microbacteriaceae bacterium]